MAHELAIDKTNIGLAMKYETREKMMLKFAKPGEKFNAMLGRVCEELTADTCLPKETLDKIERLVRANAAKREKKRAMASRTVTAFK